MPQVSGCVLALDTFAEEVIPKAKRVFLWNIMEYGKS
jgi:hypothetical protein